MHPQKNSVARTASAATEVIPIDDRNVAAFRYKINSEAAVIPNTDDDDAHIPIRNA